MRNDHQPFDLAIKILYRYVCSAIFCLLSSLPESVLLLRPNPNQIFLISIYPTHLFSWCQHPPLPTLLTYVYIAVQLQVLPHLSPVTVTKLLLPLMPLFTLSLSWASAFLSASLNSQAMFYYSSFIPFSLCFLFVTSIAGAIQVNFYNSSFSYLSPSFSSWIWIATADKIIRENFFAYKIHPCQELS